MFSSYIRELTWSPGHSFVLRYILLKSLPVRGSFAVQFGDHFPSGDHLRAISKIGNGEWRNGEWGTGNGESLKGGISKIGNL